MAILAETGNHFYPFAGSRVPDRAYQQEKIGVRCDECLTPRLGIGWISCTVLEQRC